MSQLSKLFHRKTDLFHEAIVYLENEVTWISGEQKAKIVVDIMKALHVGAGGVWGPLIEAGVVSAIDFVLAEIQQYEGQYASTPAPAPTPVIIYDVLTPGALPTDAILLKMGFVVGDVKLVTKDKTGWEIIHSGGVWNVEEFDTVGFILANGQ